MGPSHSTDLFLGMAQDLGVAVSPGLRVLDFGCGYGDTVRELLARGLDAEGVDVLPYWGEAKDRYWEERQPVPADLRAHLHLAEAKPYRLPFGNDSFDLVISSQVFEHVMDYPATMREVGRVLRPQGVSIHIFPARWSMVEGHVFVPLATVFRARLWLVIWAILGIRNQYQRGLSWREVVERNQHYLINETNYPSHTAIRRWAVAAGMRVRFAPALLLGHHPGRAGRIARRVPGVSLLYEMTRQRTMILWKV